MNTSDAGQPGAEGPSDAAPGDGRSLGVMVVALVSAALASACCLGPAVLGLLGLGSLGGSLTPALEPYRPYLIVVTVLALGAALRFAYAPAPTTRSCCDRDGGAVRSSARGRTFLWMMAIVAVGLLSYPTIVSSLSRRGPHDVETGTTSSAEVELNIEGMTCDACASHVEKVLRSDRSVEAASVTFADHMARVKVRPAGSSATDLSARIARETPYKAAPIGRKEISR